MSHTTIPRNSLSTARPTGSRSPADCPPITIPVGQASTDRHGPRNSRRMPTCHITRAQFVARIPVSQESFDMRPEIAVLDIQGQYRVYTEFYRAEAAEKTIILVNGSMATTASFAQTVK